jgi:hypothetical protein
MNYRHRVYLESDDRLYIYARCSCGNLEECLGYSPTIQEVNIANVEHLTGAVDVPSPTVYGATRSLLVTRSTIDVNLPMEEQP